MPQPYNSNFGPLNPVGPQVPLFGKKVAATAPPRKLLLLGHSHVAGFGAGSGVNGLAGSAQKDLGVRVAKELTNYGLDARVIGFTGDRNTFGQSITMDFVDSRIRLTGTNWAGFANPTLGGNLLRAVTGTGRLVFTPGYKFKRFKLYIYRDSSSALADGVEVDGVPVANADMRGSTALAAVEFNTPGYSIALRNTHASAPGYLIAIEAFPEKDPDVSVLAAGHIGGLMSNFADTTNLWSARNAVIAYQPDTTVIYGLTNDINASTVAATWQASLDSLVKTATAYGQALIVIDPAGSGSGFTSGTLYADYAQAVNVVASRYGARVVDMRDCFTGTWATANARRLQYDSQHPNPAGYDLAAQLIAAKLMRG